MEHVLVPPEEPAEPVPEGDAGAAEEAAGTAAEAPVPTGAAVAEAFDALPAPPVTVIIVVRVDVEVGEDAAAGALVAPAFELAAALEAPGAKTPPVFEVAAEEATTEVAAADVEALDAAEVTAEAPAAEEAEPVSEPLPEPLPPRQEPVHCPELSPPELEEPVAEEPAAEDAAVADDPPAAEELPEELPETPLQVPVGGAGFASEAVSTYFPGSGNWRSVDSVSEQPFPMLATNMSGSFSKSESPEAEEPETVTGAQFMYISRLPI